MLRKWMILGTAALMFPLASQAGTGQELASCPITKAHYHLSSAPDFGLSFVKVGEFDDWASDLALKLTPESEPAYWFLFTQGSGSYISLVSTTNIFAKGWHPPSDSKSDRPLGEMFYFAWSGNYDFDGDSPTSTSLAPTRIFLPDLAEVMRYVAKEHYSLPHGVFVLDKCR
jgi:hypothetical protein